MRRPLMMHDWSIEHNTAAAKTSLWIYLYKTPIQLLICLNITYLHYLFLHNPINPKRGRKWAIQEI